MNGHYWKLTLEEINLLVESGCISIADASYVIAISRSRQPGKFNGLTVRVPLNKSGTIWLQPIHYYGGEHFGEPYHFLAEITHDTRASAFSRFVNSKCPWLRGKMPFTY